MESVTFLADATAEQKEFLSRLADWQHSIPTRMCAIRWVLTYVATVGWLAGCRIMLSPAQGRFTFPTRPCAEASWETATQADPTLTQTFSRVEAWPIWCYPGTHDPLCNPLFRREVCIPGSAERLEGE
jgi:hypothetical protein